MTDCGQYATRQQPKLVVTYVKKIDPGGVRGAGGPGGGVGGSVRTMIVFQSTLLPYIICGIRNSIKSPFWGRRTFLGGRKEDIQRKF
jgi:hypothetical protein